nr:putative ribonuclease H-like domain-containing protein [Tanacetum cinerariifolium]
DRESTTRGCQFLGRRLVSWQCKKQTIVATSTTEAEYVGAASCCGQVLWIQNQLLDYGLSMPCEALSREISSSLLCLRNLKLQNEEGISSLPDTELFKNLTLMGYNTSPNQKFTFQKGRIVPLFDTMLIPQGEGSGTPTKPYHTPSPEAHPTSHTTHSSPIQPPITTASIPTVTLSETTHLRKYTRRDMIAQSFALPPVADEPTSPLEDVSEGEACPTDSSLRADQDRANIVKTSTLPHDSVPKVTSPAADKGSMQLKLDELPSLCTSLQRQHLEMVAKFEAQEMEINRLKARVKLLKDKEAVATERSKDDAPIKGRNLDEGEAVAERVSDDTEEMATVLTSMDATSVLASGAAKVSTGSRSIPTAGSPIAEVPTGSDVVLTASLKFSTTTVVTPYRRRKGKEIMVESETPKKKKVQEQIDAQVARELEEQMAKEDQRMSEQVARDVEVARIHAEEELLNKESHGLRRKRGITTWQSSKLEDFIPMGSKEEAERLKRKGLSLEQKSVKKLKTLEEVHEKAKSPDEVPKEKGQRSYWKIIRLGGSLASYQFFVDPLKHMDREDLNQLWALVKESFSNRQPTVEWKLYEMCGVHQVTSKDKEILMLVEKDYPLRKGLEIVMICYKLQLENYSQMANDLILKIYKIANCPSQQGIPTASEESSYCQKKREATAVKIALLLKSRRNLTNRNPSSVIIKQHRGRGNSSTRQWEHFYTGSGKIALAVGTSSGSGNTSLEVGKLH